MFFITDAINLLSSVSCKLFDFLVSDTTGVALFASNCFCCLVSDFEELTGVEGTLPALVFGVSPLTFFLSESPVILAAGKSFLTESLGVSLDFWLAFVTGVLKGTF